MRPHLPKAATRAGVSRSRAGFCRGILAAWMLVAALSGLATAPSAVAGPQQYVPAGPETGPDYILDRLEQVARRAPGHWEVVAEVAGRVPSHWRGPADAYYFRLEDTSINIHHPKGYTYHPYIKLYFLPPAWSGEMEESDYYGDVTPSLLLGRNHDYNVFYQTQGHLTWDDPWTALATTFDLTRPRVQRALRFEIDGGVRTRLAQRLATVEHDLPEDILGRVVGLTRDGGFIYLEYSANVSFPPPAPGAPPLEERIKHLIERETRLLSDEIFSLLPDATAIYLRRVCDNRLFDTLVERGANGGRMPASDVHRNEPAAAGSG